MKPLKRSQLEKRNWINVFAALEAGVDHGWLRSSVECAFQRMSENGTWGGGEAWDDVHTLHAYGISRYHYLIPTTDLPSIR